MKFILSTLLFIINGVIGILVATFQTPIKSLLSLLETNRRAHKNETKPQE